MAHRKRRSSKDTADLSTKVTMTPVKSTCCGLSKAVKQEMFELVSQLLDVCSRPVSSEPKEIKEFFDIYNLVEKIRNIESVLRKPHKLREEAFPIFMDWLKSNDIDTSAVEIQYYDGYGYGLRATKDLREGDLVLKMPRSLMMTVESAMKSPLGELMQKDKILQVMPNITLALHLLEELNTPDSCWISYLDTLPHSYSTPLYYTPEELQYLKGSPVFGNAITQYRNIARQYAYFHQLLHKPSAPEINLRNNFTFDAYRWAVSTVMTRQNSIPMIDNSQKMTLGLIPLWDMCNHSNGLYCADYDTENAVSLCYSPADITACNQIFIFYGPRSNGEFLLHNGFVCPDNEHDRLSLKLGISKQDPLYGAKCELLSKISLHPSSLYFLHCGECPVDGNILAFLRVFCMDKDMLNGDYGNDISDEAITRLAELESPVRHYIEEKVWSYLETRCKLLLQSYKTTVQADEEELKEADISDTCRMLLQLMIGEKRMLQQTISYAARRQSLMIKNA